MTHDTTFSSMLCRALLLGLCATIFSSCFARVSTPVASRVTKVPSFRVTSTDTVGVAWLRGNEDAEFIAIVQLPEGASGAGGATKGKRRTKNQEVSASQTASFGLGNERNDLIIEHTLTQKGSYVRHDVTIDGKPYDLDTGRIFSIDARSDGPIQVIQR